MAQPKTFSRYAIIGPLPDAGPHLKAFEARQSGLDRHVELRVLSQPVTAQDPAYHRFVREFQALAAMDHPHLIKVLDLGSADGRLYYTTDLRDATTLREYLESAGGRLDAEDALELLLPVGDALATLHRKGVLHRDVSLDSIRVDRALNRAYLATFAVMKVLRMPSLTDRGFQAPTPGACYTPEQSEGWKETGKTDIYLLATVLYQALTGRPIPSAREMAEGKGGSPFELEPPSVARTGVPDSLDEPLMDALAFKPDSRPRSLPLFLEGLRRVQKKIQARGVARTTGLPTVGQPAVRVSTRRRKERDRPTTEAPDLLKSGVMRDPAIRLKEQRGLVSILAVLVAAGGFALFSGGSADSGPAEVARLGHASRRRKLRRRRSPATRAEVRDKIQEIAREVNAEPTDRDTFESRWKVLRAFVVSLPRPVRDKHFSPAVMANLQIDYFRDPQAASETLDGLLAKAAQVARGAS